MSSLSPRLRQHLIEALTRRAQVHDDDVRRLLDEKLGKLRAMADDARPGAPAAEPPRRSALADLVERIGHTAAAHDERAELKALTHFRATWTRVNAHQRLKQSLAQVPQNAGPLNSQHLVHRALTLMRDASPDYLAHFMSYVDTLMWLEQTKS